MKQEKQFQKKCGKTRNAKKHKNDKIVKEKIDWSKINATNKGKSFGDKD